MELFTRGPCRGTEGTAGPEEVKQGEGWLAREGVACFVKES